MTGEDPHHTEINHTVPSRVAFRQHPLHPAVVMYPVAFLSTIVLTDLLFVLLDDAFWARLSLLLGVAGLATGVVAALLGFADFVLVREIRRHIAAWSHFIAAVMVLALAAAGVMLRWADPVAAVWPWGLLLSSVTWVLVTTAGWLGGTLSFKYGIGVYGREDSEQVLSHDPPRKD